MNKKILLIFLFIVSCSKDHSVENYKFEESEESGAAFDLVFPEVFWNKILKLSPPTLKTDMSIYDLVEALPVKVQLIEGVPGILRNKNHQISFKEFGGKIDLSQYLHPDINGDFVLRLNPEDGPEDHPVELKKVFFLSWTEKQNVSDETFGGGCNQIYDITNYFNKKMSTQGLKMHKSQNRYFYLTSGRFYFVYYLKNKIRLSQITILDQKLENKLCGNRI